MTSGKNQSRVLLRSLPSDSSIIASAWPETIQTGFPRLRVVSLHGLSDETADGLIIDERACGKDAGAIPALLRLTAPGGIALVDVPGKWLSKKDWSGLAAGAGFRIISERWSDGRLLGVLERPFATLRSKTDTAFSIILPVTQTEGSRSYDNTTHSVFSWMTFFLRYHLYDRSEFILVDDDVVRDDQGSELGEAVRQGNVQILRHYRSFGLNEAILTGLRRARGRRVLLDLSGGGVSKESLFCVLEPVLREEKSMRSRHPHDAGRSVIHGWTPQTERVKERALRRAGRVLLRIVTGSVNPLSDFRLYPRDAARQISLRRDIGTLSSGTLSRSLRKEGYRLLDVAVGRTDGMSDPLPSVMSALWRRFLS